MPEKAKNDLLSQLQSSFDSENFMYKSADLSINDKRISISKNMYGTRRLFDLIPIYGKALEEHVIFVDELDSSFHSKLTQEFLRRYYTTCVNSKSQLIFSTHDTSMMDLSKYRQDGIWFVERMENHGSRLFSLQTYKERFDKDVANEYLKGKYGALPIFDKKVL